MQVKDLESVLLDRDVSGMFIGRSAVPGKAFFCSVRRIDGQPSGEGGNGQSLEDAVRQATRKFDLRVTDTIDLLGDL